MWIKCTNPATVRLFQRDIMDKPIEFSDNGTAQVSAAVGEALIDQHDAIIEHETD